MRWTLPLRGWVCLCRFIHCHEAVTAEILSARTSSVTSNLQTGMKNSCCIVPVVPRMPRSAAGNALSVLTARRAVRLFGFREDMILMGREDWSRTRLAIVVPQGTVWTVHDREPTAAFCHRERSHQFSALWATACIIPFSFKNVAGLCRVVL